MTTNFEGYWRMRRLADRSREHASLTDVDAEWPGVRQDLEADLRAALTSLAGAEFAARYLAEPLPRPPIEVRTRP